MPFFPLPRRSVPCREDSSSWRTLLSWFLPVPVRFGQGVCWLVWGREPQGFCIPADLSFVGAAPVGEVTFFLQ